VTASLPWELLWQTLTSQGFLFYSKCNTAEWAQPYAVSHWCASFQPTLFLGNKCCSALHGASYGPFRKQPTVNEWPFVVLLSYWSAPQCALPPVTFKEGPLGKWLRKGGVVVISLKVREEADSGILLEGPEITQPWASGWAGSPREQAGDYIL